MMNWLRRWLAPRDGRGHERRARLAVAENREQEAVERVLAASETAQASAEHSGAVARDLRHRMKEASTQGERILLTAEGALRLIGKDKPK